MKTNNSILRSLSLLCCLMLSLTIISCDAAVQGQPEDFNFGWRFMLADLDESAASKLQHKATVSSHRLLICVQNNQYN